MLAAEETHWLDLAGQTAWEWAEGGGGGKSADGVDGGCVCVGGEEMVVYVLEGEGREEEGAAGS